MREKTQPELTRRSFLKWSTASASMAAGLTACSKAEDGGYYVGSAAIQDSPNPVLEGGEWVTAACPTCSGFRCVNKVYMKDGIPVRQKTDDSPYPHTLETPLHRACVKGRDMRFQVFNPNRIKYPMKRKNWKPGGADHHPELRGKDEWVRISWDEALKYVHDEIKRIGDTYGSKGSFRNEPGNEALQLQHTLEPEYGKKLPILNLGTSDEPVFLNVAGYGSLPTWGESSQGAFPIVNQFMGSIPGGTFDRFTTLENVKLLILWGNNPVWSSYGNQHYFFNAMKERGVKIIAVDPWFNPGNNAFTDYWVPCRPGTDSALILGIAHELITNNWVDTQFISNNTAGYDEDSMPLYDTSGNPLKDGKGNDLTEMVGTERKHKHRKNCFKNYVLGTSDYDSIPKTAKWASAICGAPEELIKQFARDLGTIKPCMLTNANAPARTYTGGLFAQGINTLKWITGSLGKAGNGSVSAGGSYTATVGYSPYLNYGVNFRVPYTESGQNPRVEAKITVNFMTAVSSRLANPKAAYPYGDRGQSWNLDHGSYKNYIYYGVAYADAWNAVIEGKHRNFTDNIYSDTTDSNGMGWKNQEIRAMVKLHGSNPLNQFVNARRGIEAFRSSKVEFIFVQDVTFGASAQFADIVVPFVSLWELDGQISYQNREMFIGNAERVIPPLFEAKTSKWTDGMLCQMFGGTYADGDPISQKQASFNYLANTEVIKPDRSGWEPLISFTNDDIAKLGVDLKLNPGTADLSQGRITFKEFKKQGFYKISFNESMRQNFPAVYPATIATQSGKGQIYSYQLKEYYDKFGFTKIEPICVYQESVRGYEEAVREPAFPLQMINVIALARVLGRPGSPGLKEIFGDGVYMNPLDAQKYGGLKSGDTVLVTSKGGGRALLHAIVTHTVMPGVIMSPCGIAIDTVTVTIDGKEEEIDRAGNSNFLSEGLLCAGGHEAFNTCLVKVEKWTGEPLPPDYKVNSMADKLNKVF